jgi:hypothetical protein
VHCQHYSIQAHHIETTPLQKWTIGSVVEFSRPRFIGSTRITATVEIHISQRCFLRRSRAFSHPDLSPQSESRGTSPTDSDHRDSSRCLARVLAPQVCDTITTCVRTTWHPFCFAPRPYRAPTAMPHSTWTRQSACNLSVGDGCPMHPFKSEKAAALSRSSAVSMYALPGAASTNAAASQAPIRVTLQDPSLLLPSYPRGRTALPSYRPSHIHRYIARYSHIHR